MAFASASSSRVFFETLIGRWTSGVYNVAIVQLQVVTDAPEDHAASRREHEDPLAQELLLENPAPRCGRLCLGVVPRGTGSLVDKDVGGRIVLRHEGNFVE